MGGELVLITGGTGFIGFAVVLEALKAGYRVRISVRRASQAEELKSHHLIVPFATKLEFVVVPDVTVSGAFDNFLEGVSYIEHIASPVPKPKTADPENEIIFPAIHGTTSILNSALKHRNIKRVVITSSIVALLSEKVISTGSPFPISSSTRINPLPVAPFNDYDPSSAYLASKALSLDAADKFVKEKKPHFSVVNIMPGLVFGRNELVKDAKSLVSGSNAIVLSIVLDFKSFLTGKLPLMITHLQDVARVEIEALDEEKLMLGAGESRSFLLDGGSALNGIELDDAKDIVRKEFPEAVKDGKLKLGGSIEGAKLSIESAETVEIFGKLRSYGDAVRSVVGQYLELLTTE